MLLKELFAVTGLSVLDIHITGVGVVVDVGLQYLDFVQSGFGCLDGVGEFIKARGQPFDMSDQILVVIQSVILQEQIDLGKLFSVELLCPMDIAAVLAIGQSLLDVNEHTELFLWTGLVLLAG